MFGFFKKKKIKTKISSGLEKTLLYIPIEHHNVFQHDISWEMHKVYDTTKFSYIDLQNDPRLARKVILELIDFNKPDILHMQIQRSDVIDARFLSKIKKNYPEILISHWSGDAQYNENFVKASEIADFTFFASYKNVDDFRAKGINAFYLQHNFESNVSKRLNISKEYDVVYLGGRYKGTDEQNVRYNLIKAANKRDLKIWGMGWKEIEANPYVHIQSDKVNEIYNKAKIGLNINHWHDHRMNQSDRAYMIMASGTFCLSYYHPDSELILGPDGKYTRYFSNEKELLALIDYYLSNEEERESIALRGHEFALKYNSAKSRVDELTRYWKNAENLHINNFNSETLKLNDKIVEVIKNELAQVHSLLDMSESRGDLAGLLKDNLPLDFPITIVDRGKVKQSDNVIILKENPIAIPVPGGIFESVVINLVEKNQEEISKIMTEVFRLDPEKIIIIHDKNFTDKRAVEIFSDNYLVSVINL